MRRRPERCASIVGAKQKGDEPPASHVSVTDVALSYFPQNATGLDHQRRESNGSRPAGRKVAPGSRIAHTV
jgi:hypothetical protein